MGGIFADFAATATRWRTWWLMAGQDISLRYRRSTIGPFWISLTMATLVCAMAFLYSEIFQQDMRVYLTFLACGLMAWSFLTTLVNEATGVVIENEGNIRSLPIPIPVLSARMVARNVIIFLHNVAVIIPLIMLFGVQLTPIALLAVPGAFVYVGIGYFAGIALGPLSARFRDVPQVVSNVFQAMFFLSPIFWMPSQMAHRPVVKDINPIYHLLEIVRAPLLGEAPTQLNWIVSGGVLAATLVLAIFSLAASRRRVFLWV